MSTLSYCPSCHFSFRDEDVFGNLECEECGYVVERLCFAQNGNASAVGDALPVFPTASKRLLHAASDARKEQKAAKQRSSSSTPILPDAECIPSTEYTGHACNSSIESSRMRALTPKAFGENRASSCKRDYRTSAKDAQTAAMIKEFHKGFNIGNVNLVIEMINKLGEDRSRKNRQPHTIERLVAACSYIQGKLNEEPLTLKDISCKAAFLSKNSRAMSRWVNSVCRKLRIHRLPAVNALDVLQRALSSLALILEGNDAAAIDEEVSVTSVAEANQNKENYASNFSDTYLTLCKSLGLVDYAKLKEVNDTNNENENRAFDIFSVPLSLEYEQNQSSAAADMVCGNQKRARYKEIQCLIQGNKEEMQKLATEIRKQSNTIVYTCSLYWKLACEVEGISLQKDEALDGEWRKRGSCKAALLSATLFISLATLKIPVPQLLVSFVLNASKSAVYRRRHALLSELYIRLRRFPAYSHVCDTRGKDLFDVLHAISKTQNLGTILGSVPSEEVSNDAPPLQKAMIKIAEGRHFANDPCEEGTADESCCINEYQEEENVRVDNDSKKGSVTHAYGVYYEPNAERWVCKWRDGDRKLRRKCFSAKRHGHEGESLANAYLQQLRRLQIV